MPKNVVRKVAFDPAKRRSIEHAIAQGRGIETGLRHIGDEQVINRTVSALNTRVMLPLMRLLRIYPPRSRGMKMRWKSKKQQRYVLAMLTARAKADGRYPDISYKRTGGLGDAWEHEVVYDKRRRTIRIRVENTAERRDHRSGQMVKIHPFVTGNIGMGMSKTSVMQYRKPMQPFHVDRGWQPAYKDIADYVGVRAPKEAYERYEALLKHIAETEYPS